MVIMHILPPLSIMSLLAGDSIGDSVSFQNQHLRVYWEEHTTLPHIGQAPGSSRAFEAKFGWRQPFSPTIFGRCGHVG